MYYIRSKDLKRNPMQLMESGMQESGREKRKGKEGIQGDTGRRKILGGLVDVSLYVTPRPSAGFERPSSEPAAVKKGK